MRAGTQLGAAELGLAAALNFPRLPVGSGLGSLCSHRRRARRGGGKPRRGQNRRLEPVALLAALRDAGAEVRGLGIGPDEPEALRQARHRCACAKRTCWSRQVGCRSDPRPSSRCWSHWAPSHRTGETKAWKAVLLSRLVPSHARPTPHPLPGGERRSRREREKLAFGLPRVSRFLARPPSSVFVRPALRKMQGFGELQRPTTSRAPGYRRPRQRPTGPSTSAYPSSRGSRARGQTTGSQSSSRLMSLRSACPLVRIPPGRKRDRRRLDRRRLDPLPTVNTCPSNLVRPRIRGPNGLPLSCRRTLQARRDQPEAIASWSKAVQDGSDPAGPRRP